MTGSASTLDAAALAADGSTCSTMADKSDVFDYIECFYNPTRRHSTLGNVSPIQIEQAQEAWVSVH